MSSRGEGDLWARDTLRTSSCNCESCKGMVTKMATVKKGIMTKAEEWWKHLRATKKSFWRLERRVKRDTRKQVADVSD